MVMVISVLFEVLTCFEHESVPSIGREGGQAESASNTWLLECVGEGVPSRFGRERWSPDWVVHSNMSGRCKMKFLHLREQSETNPEPGLELISSTPARDIPTLVSHSELYPA